MGEEFPEELDAASELIERLRTENGYPAHGSSTSRPARGERGRGGDVRRLDR